jgi:hypothetical protein
MTKSKGIAIVLLPLTLAVLGCSQQTTVQGEVTLNGTPVKEGSISFRPVDGIGPSFGSMIKDGSYSVEKAVEGEKIAVVTAIDVDQLATSRDEFAKPNKSPGPFELIPPDAKGNHQKTVIAKGAQTIDFAITTQ